MCHYFKYWILFSFIFIVISCKQENKGQGQVQTSNCNSKIDSVTVIYYNSLFKPFSGIKCESINQIYIPDFKNEDEGVLDAVIKECNILNEIEKEILNLAPSDLLITEDIRIAATIYYKDKTKQKICIGDMYASSIFLDGVLQKPNNRLLYLIKNNIGYYPWFGELILDMMDELKDTTFVKEPFIESSYYKLYEKMKVNED